MEQTTSPNTIPAGNRTVLNWSGIIAAAEYFEVKMVYEKEENMEKMQLSKFTFFVWSNDIFQCEGYSQLPKR